MENLNFFTVDPDYVRFLKAAESAQRGFTRIPDMEYGKKRKQKFLCGVVLTVGELDYYVPVTSYNLFSKRFRQGTLIFSFLRKCSRLRPCGGVFFISMTFYSV